MEKDKIEVHCIKCKWKHNGNPSWKCDCGNFIDIFYHKGQCPYCKTRWAEIQCPGHGGVDGYSFWRYLDQKQNNQNPYKSEESLQENGSNKQYLRAAGEIERKGYESIKGMAELWLTNKSQYFYQYPNAKLLWNEIDDEEPCLLALIESGLKQLFDGFGFSITNPFVNLDIIGFSRLIDILLLSKENRVSHYNFQGEFVIDEFDIFLNGYFRIKLFLFL